MTLTKGEKKKKRYKGGKENKKKKKERAHKGEQGFYVAARNPEGYDWVQQASGLNKYDFWRDSGVRENSALTTRGLSDLSFFPRGFGPEN